mmetsp:Transcript_62270/g.181920  ORF Transcript_62270/g.181920 Transcript_62270/m.181920 type:complete len:207 (+) Transcript_62270:421-1041(+)
MPAELAIGGLNSHHSPATVVEEQRAQTCIPKRVSRVVVRPERAVWHPVAEQWGQDIGQKPWTDQGTPRRVVDLLPVAPSEDDFDPWAQPQELRHHAVERLRHDGRQPAGPHGAGQALQRGPGGRAPQERGQVEAHVDALVRPQAHHLQGCLHTGRARPADAGKHNLKPGTVHASLFCRRHRRTAPAVNRPLVQRSKDRPEDDGIAR